MNVKTIKRDDNTTRKTNNNYKKNNNRRTDRNTNAAPVEKKRSKFIKPLSFKLDVVTSDESFMEATKKICTYIPFDLISIPVYCYNSILNGNDNKKTYIVGFVREYNKDLDKIEVTIFNAYKNELSKYNAENLKCLFDIKKNHDGKIEKINKICIVLDN